MQYNVFSSYETLSAHTGQYILDYVRNNPTATICVASGDTPIGTFQYIVNHAKPDDFKAVTMVALDEWVGISANNAGSCRACIDNFLVKPLHLSATQVSFFDGQAQDLEAECKRVNDLIASKGGLDLIVVGTGVNGHIGLNEPHTPFDTYAHVSALAPITIEVGQKYFQAETILTQGITVGLRHFLEAKTAIVIANGTKKQAIVKRILDEPISEALPASILKLHPNSYLWVDETANPLS